MYNALIFVFGFDDRIWTISTEFDSIARCNAVLFIIIYLNCIKNIF